MKTQYINSRRLSHATLADPVFVRDDFGKLWMATTTTHSVRTPLLTVLCQRQTAERTARFTTAALIHKKYILLSHCGCACTKPHLKMKL